MFVRAWCAAVLLSIVAAPSLLLAQQSRHAQPSQQQADEEDVAIPDNVDAGILASEVMSLLRRSDTFRAQCARIAAAPQVRVRLDIVPTIDGGRAQTAIRRYTTGVLRADVELLFGENYRELLAHEFEHVLEQIEGVNLRQEAAEGRAWVLRGGAFETRRAFVTGVQVLREAEGSHVHASAFAPPTR